jgi:hypothetical protein
MGVKKSDNAKIERSGSPPIAKILPEVCIMTSFLNRLNRVDSALGNGMVPG